MITSLTFAAGDTDRKEVRAVWGLDLDKDGVADCMEEKCTLTYDYNAAAVGKTAADPGFETETRLYRKGYKANTRIIGYPVIEGYTGIGWTEQPQPVVAKDAAQIPQAIDLIKMDSDKTVYLLWAEDANNNDVPDFEEQQGGELGDVNGDGEVDNVDAAIVLQYDAGILDEADIVNFNLGDVNADGEVDNVDAALILQYDAGLIDGFNTAQD